MFGSLYILTPEERRAFYKFKRKDVAVLTRSEFEMLRKIDLVKGALGGQSDWFDNLPEKGKCEISERGKRYREKLKEEINENRVEWLRYWVTTVISALSMFISFIALMRTL